MTKRPFNFSMSVRERIGGLIYILMHCWIIPVIVVLADKFLLIPRGIEYSESVLNLIIYGIGFVFCILFMWKFLKKSFNDIFEYKGGFLGNVIGGILLYYFMTYAVSVVMIAVLGDFKLVNPNTESINQLIGRDFNVMAVMSVIFAPVVEECMFRGALFGTIRTKNRFLAYLVTTVVFAVYHLWAYFITDYSWQLWVYLLQYVPATLVLCRAYERSGTIWCPIALHAIINLIAVNVSRML